VAIESGSCGHALQDAAGLARAKAEAQAAQRGGVVQGAQELQPRGVRLLDSRRIELDGLTGLYGEGAP